MEPSDQPDAPSAPDPAVDGTTAEMAPQRRTRPLSPLTIMGLIALVACGACTIALLLKDEGEPTLVLGTITAAAGLLGAWLVAWGRSWRIIVPVAILFLALASLCFSLRWQTAGWPTAGIGGGALGAWAYARRGRAVIATCTLLAAGYAVAAAAGLLMAMRATGHWYLAGQGLGSLVLGGLFLRFGTAEDDDDGAGHHRLRVAGRLLIVCGILLPYAALVLQAVGKALRG